ncbi:MAG: prolipoprotein diacylglyceryl transferase [Sulfurovum sp.]
MDYIVWNIDPNIFQYGGIQLRWYGLLFVGSFFLGLMIFTKIYKLEKKDPVVLDNLLLYVMIGTVIGARLGHCLFYEPEYYLSNPIEILKVWRGGLASHGGLAGILISLYIFAKRYNTSYTWLLARMTIVGTLTASFVRVGNLFNSEILGVETTVPWAIVFERVDLIPRHPVQLYEALAYFIIFIILSLIYRRVSPSFATKILPGSFLVLIFSARFLIEYFKTQQSVYSLDIPFSTGQLLSIPYILFGILWIIWAFTSSNNKNNFSKDKKI